MRLTLLLFALSFSAAAQTSAPISTGTVDPSGSCAVNLGGNLYAQTTSKHLWSCIGTPGSPGTWTDVTPSSGGGSYTLPQATTSTLGGVKCDGTTTTCTGGVLSVGVVPPSVLAPAVVLTYGSTLATNVALSSHFRVTLTGNATLSAPTNPIDGQKVTWEFVQDGTGSRTITLDSSFSFGTDVTGVTLTTTANKRDFLGAIWNATTSKWYVVSFAKGY